jgi:hypothetical protein
MGPQVSGHAARIADLLNRAEAVVDGDQGSAHALPHTDHRHRFGAVIRLGRWLFLTALQILKEQIPKAAKLISHLLEVGTLRIALRSHDATYIRVQEKNRELLHELPVYRLAG